MSARMLTYRGTVYPWHCDHVGHMNVMWYVGKFDEATWQLLNAIGLTPSYFRSEKRGMAAVDHHISYFNELRAGAVISVYSTILEVKAKSICFVHEMVDDESGEVVARATLKGVHIDTELRKSCPMDEAIVAKAAAFIAPQAAE